MEVIASEPAQDTARVSRDRFDEAFIDEIIANIKELCHNNPDVPLLVFLEELQRVSCEEGSISHFEVLEVFLRFNQDTEHTGAKDSLAKNINCCMVDVLGLAHLGSCAARAAIKRASVRSGINGSATSYACPKGCTLPLTSGGQVLVSRSCSDIKQGNRPL